MRITDIGKHKKLMEAVRYISEAPLAHDELAAMKAVIANKIKELPEDEATAKALREIQDLLAHVNAGGRKGIINGKLQEIQDDTVRAAHDLLSRFIFSMEVDPSHRDEMFDLWRKDKLVNRSVLLGPGKKTFSQVFKNYDKNDAVKELVDHVMQIAALGQGKGEFGLSVLSKNINKQPGNKGDLEIDGKKIEVKTFDKAAARFTDQEVIPAAGYEQAKNSLNEWLRSLINSLGRDGNKEIPKSGVNLNKAVAIANEISQMVEGKQLTKKVYNDYIKQLDKVITLIFGGSNASSDDVNEIMNAIKEGNAVAATQAYGKASFNYYFNMKDDEGVLNINLPNGYTVFYKDADELEEYGLGFKVETSYVTGVPREIYPKITVVDRTGGASGSIGSAEDGMASEIGAAAGRVAKAKATKPAVAPKTLAPAPATRTAKDKTAGMRKLK